jgi:hypothetical protein
MKLNTVIFHIFWVLNWLSAEFSNLAPQYVCFCILILLLRNSGIQFRTRRKSADELHVLIKPNTVGVIPPRPDIFRETSLISCANYLSGVISVRLVYWNSFAEPLFSLCGTPFEKECSRITLYPMPCGCRLFHSAHKHSEGHVQTDIATELKCDIGCGHTTVLYRYAPVALSYRMLWSEVFPI